MSTTDVDASNITMKMNEDSGITIRRHRFSTVELSANPAAIRNSITYG
ncbi:MAG: hypothetical protein H0V07_09615 [Propionibacteriales bacterium]|nr:hypothetical protein [Propionibacteriales bacterium]